MSGKRAGNPIRLYSKAETVEQLIEEIQRLKFSESLTVSDETVAYLSANAKLPEQAKLIEEEQLNMLVEENSQNKASIRQLQERLNRMRDCKIDGDVALREETEQRAQYYALSAIGIGWVTVAAVSLAHFVLSH